MQMQKKTKFQSYPGFFKRFMQILFVFREEEQEQLDIKWYFNRYQNFLTFNNTSFFTSNESFCFFLWNDILIVNFLFSSNPLRRAYSGFMIAACASESCSVTSLLSWKLCQKPAMNVHRKKLTNESKGKPEHKFDVAFGPIFRISICFQRT